jgi:protein-S-isoprenylcysteine O-methyltransferase Ste14
MVTILGAAILAVGLALDLAGVAAVITHRTTIVPHRTVATLITDGVYRVSRNPMYTGLAIMVGGGALLAGTWWPLLLLPLAILAVTKLAIQPEEAYLTEHFDSRYTDYQREVRRWL